MPERSGVQRPSPPSASLADPRVRAVLERLHGAARGDLLRFPKILPRALLGFARGRSFAETITPGMMRGCYLAVPRQEGEFLYLTARAIGARNVVEFGTSFGISTLYLAAAVRDNGGGRVIGSELETNKHSQAVANLEEAGLGDVAEVRLGDALETLRELPDPVDLVFLDGWKDLYVPVLDLVEPKLRPGSVVLADNIHTFKKALRPYVERVQAEGSGFVSSTMPISDGVEYSVRVG
jgi:predicted O-methyltransferase YrrM